MIVITTLKLNTKLPQNTTYGPQKIHKNPQISIIVASYLFLLHQKIQIKSTG